MSQRNKHSNDRTTKAESSEPSQSTEKPGSRFSKRKLTYDWSKYDELPPEEPEEHIDQYDFDYLAKNYSADNSYFQLSSEKEWSKPPPIPTSTLFALNLKNLSAGLACLPFYDLIDVDKSLLSDTCIANCDAEAKANLMKYKPELDNSRAKHIARQKDIITNTDEETNVASVLDTSLHITPPEKNVLSVAKTESIDISQGEDLEDWLDSVLDD